MINFSTSYQFLSVLGLILDIIAIFLMFHYPELMTTSSVAKKSKQEEWV